MTAPTEAACGWTAVCLVIESHRKVAKKVLSQKWIFGPQKNKVISTAAGRC